MKGLDKMNEPPCPEQATSETIDTGAEGEERKYGPSWCGHGGEGIRNVLSVPQLHT